MAANPKKVLFIDRDGTIVVEPAETLQIDKLEQLEFLPRVLRNLYFIRHKLDFEWAVVTNQDGLGTSVYPQENFDNVQQKMIQILGNEGVYFDKIFIDKSFPEENLSTRKPGIAMLESYLTDEYDLEPALANTVLGAGIVLSLLTVPFGNLLLGGATP